LPTHDEAAAALALRARLRDGAAAALSTDADRFALCLAGVERADAKLEAVVFMVRAALERTHARTRTRTRTRTHIRTHIEGWRCCRGATLTPDQSQALLPQLLQATAASISLLAAAPRAVRQSAALRRCLGLCLRLGNALNRGTARGDAAGFDVSVLPSLAAVKATGGGKGGEGGKGVCDSLLHCIAAEMARDAAEGAGGAGPTEDVKRVGAGEEAAAAAGEGPAAVLQAELAPLLSEAEAVGLLCSTPSPNPSPSPSPNPTPVPALALALAPTP
jgi:hypothetical protein